MIINHQKQKGFTLVELIIYVLIVSVVLVAITYYAIDVLSAQTKAKSYQEAQYNARFAMRRIINEIRRADGLVSASSTFAVSPGALTLNFSDPAYDPVVFDVSANRLRLTRGAAGPVYLTSDKVEITNLIFENLSVNNRTENIKISLTVGHRNPENRNEFEADVTLESSAVIRAQED